MSGTAEIFRGRIPAPLSERRNALPDGVFPQNFLVHITASPSGQSKKTETGIPERKKASDPTFSDRRGCLQGGGLAGARTLDLMHVKVLYNLFPPYFQEKSGIFPNFSPKTYYQIL